MFQFFADNIDQLDLALDQLAVADRNFDRFALMLIDNVVELTFHKFIQDKARENEMWTRLEEPRHDPKVIQKGLGQNFDAKAKASSNLGLMDSKVCESILNLHSFRNTAYHKGLRHEGILHSLAIFYFRNACDLLSRYKPSFWSSCSSDRISHRALKYLGKIKFCDHETAFRTAYARLDEVAASMTENLVGDLAADMAKTIDEADTDISFLADEAPIKSSRDEVIIDCQAWPFAFTEEAKAFAKNNGYQGQFVGSYIEWIANNYKWPINKDPIIGWQARLQDLAKEADYHMALKRYCDFMHQTEDIRSKLSESAHQLDAHIQMQIDAARGK